jgi:transposase InsO family protein
MKDERTVDRWARLRFAIIGPLLAAPPANGELKSSLESLASKTWTHPINGTAFRYSVGTLERFYYRARHAQDPVAALRPRQRCDKGHRRQLNQALRDAIKVQYQNHPGWSIQLHVDNLAALCEQHPHLQPMASYSTVRRYLKSQGWHRIRALAQQRPGALKAHERRAQVEVRSFEAAYNDQLWHLDYHVGSRDIITASGQRKRPQLLGIIDDHSRLICHMQWYLDQSAYSLVHGLSQALQKRCLPRALMSDNGSAMKSAEFGAGLLKLGIQQDFTQSYSPEQNAKIEVLWGSVEGRLMAMLENVKPLDLDTLNQLTQLWVEYEYNQRYHREIAATPIDRYRQERRIGRECPGSEALREAFQRTETRRQRTSDGTISVARVRFEIPSRYRQLSEIRVRFAQWDLSHVQLLDPNSDRALCRLYPLDKHANADGQRRVREPVDNGSLPVDTPVGSTDTDDDQLPALMRQWQADFAATGLPCAYVKPINKQDASDE